MKEIKVSDIVVGDRFRKKFEEIDSLAASIQSNGLINPIVIDENNVLIAGERRLKAHQLLKKETILARCITELDEVQKKELEIEENIQRKEFTWQEEVTAKSQLHALKQKLYGIAVKGHEVQGTWKVKDTAQALGESVGSTSMDLQLAMGMKAFPELLKEKSKTVAYKKLKSLQERLLQEELAKRLKQRGVIDSPELINDNCLEAMEGMESGSIDLILTDPPYGIDVGDSQTFGRQNKVATYEDSDFETFDLLDKAISQMFRLLKQDRHMFIFCGIDKVPALYKLLTKHGFDVHHLPLIWDKGSGSYPSQSTTFVHSYEAFLHCRKGTRKLNGTPRDIFSIKRTPSDKKIHPSEKPTELLRDLISLTTLPGEKVLDPFCGSASTIVACKETNRQGIGIELDNTFYTLACRRLEDKVNG